jgi:cytochrome b561
LFKKDQRYDSATISLHWLTVALVAILWILGQVTGWLPRGPFRLGVWSTHVVLGLTLVLVLGMRILWRAGFGSALPPADRGVLHWLAKGTHYALYLLLVAVVILGIANASYMGFNLYGVLTMPRFGNGDPATERSINTLHERAANLAVLIAFFHAAAALGHQYIWRDRLLQRMRPRL